MTHRCDRTSPIRNAKLIPVLFGGVAVGAFFKEPPSGTWHLKTDEEHGMYQSWGTRHEPRFQPKETVYVEEKL